MYVLFGLGASASLMVMLGLTPGIPSDVPGSVCIADRERGSMTISDTIATCGETLCTPAQ